MLCCTTRRVRRAFRGLALAAILIGWGPARVDALPFFFRFTPIADTSGGFPYASLTQFPCINSSDRVAFWARLTGGVEGMFSRKELGGVDTLAATGTGDYDLVSTDCSINSDGTVAFETQKIAPDATHTFFMRAGGGVLTQTLFADSGPYTVPIQHWQINAQAKTVVLTSRVSDNVELALTKGAGPLSGPEKIYATTGPGSTFTNFSGAAINGVNTVALIAGKADGSPAIFTVTEGGLVSQLLDTSAAFAGFDDLALNDSGSVAFDGAQWGPVFGAWRIDPGTSSPSITKIADSFMLGPVEFNGVAINDSGTVAFVVRDPTDFLSSVYIGSGGPVRQLLGFGSVLFGRSVYSVTTGREAINNLGQIIVSIAFADGSQMIARADPVRFPGEVVAVGNLAIALSTGSGSGSGIGTPIAPPPTLLSLSFDLTFLTMGGELKVLLGDKEIRTIAASRRGVRQRMRVPIDLRGEATGPARLGPRELRFAITGPPGATVQISDVAIPGVFRGRIRSGSFAPWHVDRGKGGAAVIVDTTRLPVHIQVATEHAQRASSAGTRSSVTILSSEDFNATRDIDRDTLTLNGVSPLLEEHGSKDRQPDCREQDVNHDKRPDLVCDFPFAGSSAPTLRIEGMSRFGWGILGVTQVRDATSGHPMSRSSANTAH